MLIKINRVISTSNSTFKKEIWNKIYRVHFFEILKSFKIFKISKNERGKFSPNFTNKHVIPG